MWGSTSYQNSGCSCPNPDHGFPLFIPYPRVEAGRLSHTLVYGIGTMTMVCDTIPNNCLLFSLDLKSRRRPFSGEHSSCHRAPRARIPEDCRGVLAAQSLECVARPDHRCSAEGVLVGLDTYAGRPCRTPLVVTYVGVKSANPCNSYGMLLAVLSTSLVLFCPIEFVHPERFHSAYLGGLLSLTYGH